MTSVPPADLMPPDDTPFGSGDGDAGGPGAAPRDDSIPLPDGGTGQRRARRLQRMRERRHRWLRIGAIALVAVSVAAVLAAGVTRLHLPSSGGRGQLHGAAGASSAPPPAVLGQAGGAGRGGSVVVGAGAPRQRR